MAAQRCTPPRFGPTFGVCGQAPSDHPDFARFLMERGTGSISLNPDTVMKATLAILEQERGMLSPPWRVST